MSELKSEGETASESGESVSRKENEGIGFKKSIASGLVFAIPILALAALLYWVYDKLASLFRVPFDRIYGSFGLSEILPLWAFDLLAEIIFLTALVLGIALFGWVIRKWLRNRTDNAVHHFLSHIPIIKSVFIPVKQAVQSLLSDDMKGRVVIRFPYPAKPYTAIGIVMDEQEVAGQDCYLVVVPLTMSAGTGLLITVPKECAEILPFDASRALSHVVSCGLVKLNNKSNDRNCVLSLTQLWKELEYKSLSIEIPMGVVAKTAEEEAQLEKLQGVERVDWCCNQMCKYRDDAIKGGFLRLRAKLRFGVYKRLYYAKELQSYDCVVETDDEGEKYINLIRKLKQ